MTNWEKYFSRPDLAACMQVYCDDLELAKPQIVDGKWIIKQFDPDTYDEFDGPEIIAEIPCIKDDPAALLEWMMADCGKAVSA